MRLIWVTPRRFGADLCQTTQVEGGRALVDREWEVTFVSPSDEAGGELLTAAGLGSRLVERNRRVGFQSVSLERNLRRRLPAIIEQVRPAAAIVEWAAVRGAASALATAGVPWVALDRSPPVFSSLLGRLQWWQYRRNWALAARRAAGFAVKSRALLDWLQERHGLAPDRSVIMPAGVDPARFPCAEDRPTPPIRLVYHGRLDLGRAVPDLVTVVERLREAGHDAVLRMFGRGDAVPRLEELAADRPWVELLGPVPLEEVGPLLAECHIGLIPLPDRFVWHFASPLKLFEFAAAGLPVVATDITCHRALGERDWLHLIDDTRRVDAMVEAVARLIDTDALPTQRRAARDDAETELTWAHAVGPLGDLLRSVQANWS